MQVAMEACRLGMLCRAAAQEHGTSDKRAAILALLSEVLCVRAARNSIIPTPIKTSEGINREGINGKGWTLSHDGPGEYRLKLRGRADR